MTMGPFSRKTVPGVAAIPLIGVFSFMLSSHALSANPTRILRQVGDLLGITSETDVRAPVDFGAGPGVTPKAEMKRAASTSGAEIPNGGATANVTGAFGPAVTWPIIPIHAVLLPDGRVMNYGTDQNGQQGAQLIYDIWDPTLGTDISAHTVLPNTTGTDIFCSSQSVMLSGAVLITGGDLTINGVRNFAQNDTNIFAPSADTLTANTPMHYARWYASLVALPNGHLVTFGGVQNVVTINPPQPVPTPEEYDPATQVWTLLTGATSSAAFGNGNYSNWYYPRSYVAPGGNVFVLGVDGTMYSISTAGVGSITNYSMTVAPGSETLPTVPFAPGKVLSVRANQEVDVIDFTGPVPVATQTDNIDQVRYWANGTVMADGRVLITGGSEVANELTGVDYQAQIWDPATGHWTAGASASKPRLYHSNSMLLTDATVLTGGGGAPGPVNNLNAEIYYPPYLYDSTGAAAVRPVISAAAPLALTPGGTISLTVGPSDSISRLTFVRTGSSTHSNNSDQRFLDLPFTQTGQALTAVLPGDPTVLMPGYYMLFAFNQAGVPSVATVLSVVLSANVSISASSPTATTGNPVTLTWTAASGSACTATGGSASVSGAAADGWAGSIPASGTRSVTESVGATYQYGLSCILGGETDQTQVTVVDAVPVVTASLSAAPTTISAGQATTLTWNSTNATSCTATGGAAGDAWAGGKATSGTAAITEAGVPANPLNISYTLTCSSTASGQSAQASATITENPPGTNSGAGGSSSGGSSGSGGSTSGSTSDTGGSKSGSSSAGSGSTSGGSSAGSGSASGSGSTGSGSTSGSSSAGAGSTSGASSDSGTKSGGGGSLDWLALIFLFSFLGLRGFRRVAGATATTASA
jgi:hypothetical protein